MFSRGFIYGFSQTAWALSYGVKGIFLGLLSYLPHNILLAVGVAWMEWLLYKNIMDKAGAMRRVGLLIGGMVPVISWMEAYVAKAMFLAFV